MRGFLVIVLAALFASAFGNESVSTLEERILGGGDAEEGEFPFMAGLYYPKGHFCGGSIINSEHILTAAHCVDRFTANELTVKTGTNKRDSGGESFGVSKIIIHNGYDKLNSWLNDIAILKLSSPININSRQKPVTLPQQGESVNDGVSAVLSGWGYVTWPQQGVPDKLQKVGVKVISNSQCQRDTPQFTIFKTSICTSGGRGKGVCKGDSGGPLTINGKQIGIMSYAALCAKGVPDVHTRVSEYINWIKQNTM